MMLRNEHDRRKKARELCTRHGYRLGGHLGRHAGGAEDAREDKAIADSEIRRAMGEHDRQMHEGHHTKLKLADGGVALGDHAHSRPDRAPRGKKGTTSINIVVMPQDQGAAPGAAMPMPMPPHPAVPPPMPPRPPLPPGAGMPPGMPPVMPVPVPAGGMPPRPGMPMPGAPMMRKRGGRAHMPDLTGGVGSGIGRLERDHSMRKHERHG